MICKYYAKHLERLDEKKRNAADLKNLQASLKHEYKTKFGVSSTPYAPMILC
jgi:hypothetical protein